jgi:hypothetical protein
MKPEQPRYELLSAAERDAIVAPYLRRHLQPLGLTEVSPRAWIDGSSPPVKRMFELMLLKGAGMRIRWGFSLDFVPHISGGRVQWHRTEKKAVLDIIVDPKEEALPQLSFLHGAARLREDLNHLVPTAVKKAKQTWRRGETGRGLLDLVLEIRERQTNAWAFNTYTQLPRACAFLYARLGDLGSAQQELDHYVSRLKLDDETVTKLRKLAREYAGNQGLTGAVPK